MRDGYDRRDLTRPRRRPFLTEEGTEEVAEGPGRPFPGFGIGPNPLLQAGLLADPYPLYAMLRASNPVFRLPIPVETGAGVWLLTRHADVERVLKDASFSAQRRRADVFRLYAGELPVALVEGPGGTASMLMQDPPEHTRLRGLVNKAFTPRRIAELAPRIEQLMGEILDEVLERGELDLVHDVAEPVPAIVIAELLGVPPEDHRQFREWSSELIARLPAFGQGQGEALTALERILDYLRGQIARRRRSPGDDLLSALIAARDQRDALSEDEMVATAFLLLIAGHETTTNLIGNGTLALLRSPGELERLRAEPGRLGNAIEEMLRYDSPVQATVRVATEETRLGDHELAPGALVIVSLGAANRDPAVHPEPDRFDVTRDPIRHLSFGFGTHFCLGASLARLEARCVFRALLERTQRLELATDETLRYRPNPLLRGLAELPLRAA
jgi:cytochrome P450